MPPPPSFDYYAELEIERSASLTEINSAYRRLARIHHPDKNPNNQEEATTNFQRLQLAHETLSDPVKRERYDTAPPGSIFSQEDEELWEDDEEDPFGFPPFPFPFPFEFFFTSRFFRGPPRRGTSQAQAAYDDLRAENERRRQESKRREKEARDLREEEQRLRQEAKKAREKAAERSKALERRHLQDEEMKKQEMRWKEMGAVSKEERLHTCLHSELCDKIQHTKKFKCTACSVKRGMIAFECPHCSAFLCQLCVTDFSERRKKLDMQEQMEEPWMPKDSAGTSSKPTINKPNANKSTTGESAAKKPQKKKKSKTSGAAKQTPISGKTGNGNKDSLERDPVLSEVDDDKATPTSRGLFASDNPYNILVDDEKTTSLTSEKSIPHASTPAQTAARLSTARPDGAKGDDDKPASTKFAQSKKKRQNKKSGNKDSSKENVNLHGQDQKTDTNIAVEAKATGAIHNTHRQTLAPGPSESSSQSVAAQPVSNKTVNDDVKASVSIKPQKPKHHSAPSREEKPTGPGCGPSAGATGGYIRALDAAHSPTVADLRQAMEKFGAVKCLKIVNKRRGISHVDFAAHEGLRRAIAASPVVVSEQITVRVVELKHCDTCGKAGHVARTCRAAKSPN
ncbi:hypothetical protein INS49_012936 [Diaporthe citri]|uniref:uncharacterized protein n=1 Tax=Diaporthe citri TaxID=83186 RepID=UPI001C817561|nr:uncharacterized protein INS49_012936 [Diaporthe citri]KAG6359415.1 hypothetical protein INS49_012936 [Diaporthe citri]